MSAKNVYCNKWSTEVLEQVAASCNIASNAQNDPDWNLFLSAVYDGIMLLTDKQRITLLLSQEHGLSLVDIARTMNMPISTVLAHIRAAIDKLVFYLKSRSLVKKDLFTCKAMELIYTHTLCMEDCANEPADFEFLDKYAPPFFTPRNYLFDLYYN